MARVTAFELPGIDCWFHSQDHGPPHFHAKKAGVWEVRVFFLKRVESMIEVKWKRGFLGGRETKPLCAMAEACRAELLREWEEKVQPDA